jgi:ABC-type transport system involved in multi-copper enzyme maturation permease subunit
MIGLFLNNFYKTISGMKMLMSVLFIIGAIIIGFVDSQIIVQTFIFTIILSISAYSLMSIRKDADSRWNKYEITLPVKRKTIVKSKYLSFVFWLLVATIMAALFTGIIIIVKGNKYFDFGMRDIITIFTASISLVLQICSFFHIGLYLLGLEKSDILIILSLIVSIGFTVLLAGILNKVNISIETGRTIILGASILIFWLSYNITKLLYSRFEF